MKRWYLLIFITFFAAGCVQQVQRPSPPQPAPAPQNQNVAPVPPESDLIDTNDYLDTALEELDAVE